MKRTTKAERFGDRGPGGRGPHPRGRLWLALGMSVILAGCGNLTAGGATGETTVYVTGDASRGSSTTAAALPWRVSHDPSEPDESSESDDEPEGEIELEFTVSLVRPDGLPVPLTEEDAQVEIDIPGTAEVEVVHRVVPATDYVAVRLSFTEIEVEVEDGLIIDGQPVTGPVDVEMDDTTLVVERAIDLNLEDGDRAEILVDMNAAAWLAAVDLDTQSVDDDRVAELIQVVVR